MRTETHKCVLNVAMEATERLLESAITIMTTTSRDGGKHSSGCTMRLGMVCAITQLAIAALLSILDLIAVVAIVTGTR